MERVLTHAPGTADLVTVPTDSPFLPTDLAAA
jgi:molybdopterin-guanine dinucleotide biosynthesis protein A